MQTSGEASRVDLLPGTLDLIVLRTLATMGAWHTTENNREAKYYVITRAGTRAFAEQAAWWRRSAGLVNRLLTSEAE